MRFRWLIVAIAAVALPVAAEAQCPQVLSACGGLALQHLDLGGPVNLGTWTTSTRPIPATGQFPYGYNSTIGSPEYWNGSGWVAASGGVPGGSSGQLQINNGGAFNGVTIGSGLSLSGSTLSATGTSPGGMNGQLQFNSAGVFSGISIPTGLVKGTGSTLTAASPGTDFLAPGGALGTPASGVLTNATGLPVSTGLSGLGTGAATSLGVSVNTNGGVYTYGSDTSALPVTVNGTQTTLGAALAAGVLQPITLQAPAGATITIANTFQTAIAANASRKSCLIQNTSTHKLLVYIGAAGSASSAASVPISPSGAFNCSTPGGGVLGNEISVTTSTTGDTFVAVSG